MTEPTETSEVVVDEGEQSEPESRDGGAKNTLISGPDDEPSHDETTERPKNKEELYRKQRGELKAQNEQLVERLNRMQRAEVERIASQHLADGNDFFRDGAQLADLLTEHGDIDVEKVTELANALASSHPHWRRRGPGAPPASTVTSNGKISDSQPPQATWTELLQGRVEQR
jgi:hypothetical protein